MNRKQRRAATKLGQTLSNPLGEMTAVLALLWQNWRLIDETGFPNQIFNDSWMVGFWRADHGGHEVEVGRRAWTLAQAIPGLLRPQGTAADVSALYLGIDWTG
jgi:hypothetical protein